MKKILFVLFLTVFALSVASCKGGGTNDFEYDYSKEEGDDQFDYEGNYVKPELTVDGVMDEAEWENGTEKLMFGAMDSEGNYRASVRFYRGENALYAFFEVRDTNLLTKGENNGDDVNKSDSIELYLDTKNDGMPKPQTDDFQINIGIHKKTRILVAHGGVWGSWNGLLDYEVKLDGTINDSSDIDKGYTMELMIPYAQTNMTKETTFGFSLGHVDKFGANATDSSWNPFEYAGNFIDPQSPAKYVICQGNEFFMRGQENKEDIRIEGICKNQNGTPLANVEVSLKDGSIFTTTDENGKYVLQNVNPNKAQTLVFEATDLETFEKTFSTSELRGADVVLVYNPILYDDSIEMFSILQGTVKNLANGTIENAKITIGDTVFYTNASGMFSQSVKVTKEVIMTIEKTGYVTKEITLLSEDFSIGTTQLGEISLNLLSSQIEFGGQRGINLVNAAITRELAGVRIIFTSPTKLPDSAHIELFVDTKRSGNTRNTSDYRLDFSNNGSISIVHFGDGGNTDVSASKITSIVKSNDISLNMEVYIPYSFLQIDALEVFGISAGVWSGSDWDGFGFEGNFVAPEIPSEYVRVAVNNELYRYENNNPTALIEGIITCEEQALDGVLINGIETEMDGSYSLRVETTNDLILTITKKGYVSKVVTINKADLKNHVLKNITLDKLLVSISGNTNVAGVKVYIEGQEDAFVYSDEFGAYMLSNVAANQSIKVIAEKEGYVTYTKTLTVDDLQENCTLNIVLVEDETKVSFSGVVNSAYGFVAGASIQIQNKEVVTDEFGAFHFDDLNAEVSNIVIQASGFVSVTKNITVNELVEGTLNVDLVKNSGNFLTFGGRASDNVMTITPTIFREVKGISFYFTSNKDFANGDAIEFFIDTKETTANRNASNYFIKLLGNATIEFIENYGGTNTDKTKLTITKESVNILKLFIPYTFLDISSTEVFGVSFGVIETGKNWDGYGFDGFIDPAIPSDYVRVDANNQGYRFENNQTTKVITGTVKNKSNEALANASVNGVLTNNLGEFSLRIAELEKATIQISLKGYITYFNDAFNSIQQSVLNVVLNQKMVAVNGNCTLANVKITVKGTSIFVNSDADGNFEFASLPTFEDIVLIFELEGYTTIEKTVSVSNISEDVTLETFTLVSEVVKYSISGIVNSAYGVLAGVKVTIDNNSTITNIEGAYSLNNISAAFKTMTFELEGFITKTVNIASEELIITNYDVSMVKPSGNFQTFGGRASDNVMTITPTIYRNYNVVEFYFTSSENYADTDAIEFFLDTKESATSRNATNYFIRILGNASIEFIDNYGGTNTDKTRLTVTKESANVIKLVISYEFLGIMPTEVFGVSFGVVQTGKGWDGYGFDGFVAPENPSNYVRVGADNNAYKATSNQ